MESENNLRKNFIGNTSWMMAQQVYSMVLSLIVGSLSARYLGPSNYGLINYGASLISFFLIISKLGLDGVIINEIVKNRDKTASYLGSALIARLVISVISIVIVQGIVCVLEPSDKLLHTVTLLQTFSIVLQSYEVFQYWYQVELKMKTVAMASMLALTVTAVWRIALLATGASVQFFALSNSIRFVVAGLVVTIVFFVNTRMRLKFSFSDLKYLLSISHHYIISSLTVTLYAQIDKVMIGKFISNESLGLYTAATTIACLWEFVPNAMINSARPIILEKRKNDYSGYKKSLQLLFIGITVLSFIACVCITVFGKLGIWILYGKEYMGAYWSLVIVLWSTSFAMISTARGIWLIAEDLNHYAKDFTIAGAIVNVILNAILIPTIGIEGAAIATLFSQITVTFVAPYVIKRTREFNRLYFESVILLPELWRQMKKKMHRS